MSNTDQPGGSGAGRTVTNTQQNVVINANAQAAAAQLAQQILANTNVTLKQELVKIPNFWGEKGKESTSVKSPTTGTTPLLTPTSASVSKGKSTNGMLPK
jgi:hypothetical protein